MPYKSKKQEAFFHTKTAKDKGITQAQVDDFDQASKGMKLPTYKDPMPQDVGAKSKSFFRK